MNATIFYDNIEWVAMKEYPDESGVIDRRLYPLNDSPPLSGLDERMLYEADVEFVTDPDGETTANVVEIGEIVGGPE